MLLNISFHNSIEELLKTFPELKESYIEEGQYLENSSHLTYSIIFVPFIKSTFNTNDENQKKKIAIFLENLIMSEDSKVQELVVVSVLEPIITDRELIKKIRKYIYTNSLKTLNDLEKAYGWA